MGSEQKAVVGKVVIKPCAQHFRITINGYTPTGIHSLTIIDSEGSEFVVPTLSEDPGLTEDFAGVMWPATIYLNGVEYYRPDDDGELWGVAARKPGGTGSDPWDTSFRCGIVGVEPGSGLPGDNFDAPEWIIDMKVRCSMVTRVKGGYFESLPSLVNFPWKALAFRSSGVFEPCSCGHVDPGTGDFTDYRYTIVNNGVSHFHSSVDAAASCNPGVGYLGYDFGFYAHNITGLSQVCIVSDEDGLNVSFGDPRIETGFWNVYMAAGEYDEESDEWSIWCMVENETYTPGGAYEYIMGNSMDQ